MLFALVFWGAIAVSTANPPHKYPYVFLLDVGNEELQKTNTEQLRVSIPGGSLVMKYPAMGEGDPISHVRVSGIDFGTDLKVNIAEGGPGYKYVVLLFMGNPGVTYDAVVTLQTQETVPKGTEINLTTTNKIATTESLLANPYEVSEADVEDNDKDLTNMKQYTKESKEVMQSSSKFYNYAKKEMADGDEDEETENISAEEQEGTDENDSADEEDDEDNGTGTGNQRFSNADKFEHSYQDERKVSDGDEADEENENEEDVSEKDESFKTKLYSESNFDPFSEIPRAEQYRYNVNLNNADNAKPDDVYDKYSDPKPHFGLGLRIYPQGFIYNRQYQGNSVYNKENPADFGQVLNNEEESNFNRFKDGSNSIDPDYVVAEY